MLRKTVVAGAAPRMEELVKHLEDKYRSLRSIANSLIPDRYPIRSGSTP